jgi:hypothetical protein
MRPYRNQDAQLIQTKALPNGAAAVNSDAFDLELTSRSHFTAECELTISAPLLAVGELANAATMKYDVECDSDAAFGSPRVLAKEVLVQTGAGGVGAAAATARFRLPSDVERYLRVKATNSGAGNASAKSLTVALGF